VTERLQGFAMTLPSTKKLIGPKPRVCKIGTLNST
jgi:hypothetical protein